MWKDAVADRDSNRQINTRGKKEATEMRKGWRRNTRERRVEVKAQVVQIKQNMRARN